jgi:hypothetical protein
MTKDEALKLALEALKFADSNCDIDFLEDREVKEKITPAITAIKAALAQQVQEPQYEYLIDDLAEWKQYVEVDTAPYKYGLREHVIKVLLAHGIKEKNT